jgi:8-oxo-dGTP diphosphatase
MRDTSLVYPVGQDGRILLGRKRRGMGFGKWNGFGGKIEAGETMRECAARELFEESGLKARPEDLIPVGDLYFHQPSDPEWSHAGIVYFVKVWEGTPAETEEMQPKWFLPSEFPYEICGWPTACGCL